MWLPLLKLLKSTVMLWLPIILLLLAALSPLNLPKLLPCPPLVILNESHALLLILPWLSPSLEIFPLLTVKSLTMNVLSSSLTLLLCMSLDIRSKALNKPITCLALNWLPSQLVWPVVTADILSPSGALTSRLVKPLLSLESALLRNVCIHHGSSNLATLHWQLLHQPLLGNLHHPPQNPLHSPHCLLLLRPLCVTLLSIFPILLIGILQLLR